MRKMMFLAAMTAWLVGCETNTRGTVATIDTDTGAATILENSYRLSNRIKVIRCNYDVCANGLRKATVTIQSQTKRRQRLQLRMGWLDAEGLEIEPDTKPYHAVVIDGSDTHTFTGIAPNMRGVRAKVQIRELETVD